MTNSSVFWQLFTATGQIGPYLLYKSFSYEISSELIEEEEQEQGFKEVASERG